MCQSHRWIEVQCQSCNWWTMAIEGIHSQWKSASLSILQYMQHHTSQHWLEKIARCQKEKNNILTIKERRQRPKACLNDIKQRQPHFHYNRLLPIRGLRCNVEPITNVSAALWNTRYAAHQLLLNYSNIHVSLDFIPRSPVLRFVISPLFDTDTISMSRSPSLSNLTTPWGYKLGTSNMY